MNKINYFKIIKYVYKIVAKKFIIIESKKFFAAQIKYSSKTSSLKKSIFVDNEQ